MDPSGLRDAAYAAFLVYFEIDAEPDFDIFVLHHVYLTDGACNTATIRSLHQRMAAYNALDHNQNPHYENPFGFGYEYAYHVLLGGNDVSNQMIILINAAMVRGYSCDQYLVEERWIRFDPQPGRFEEFRTLMMETAAQHTIVLTRIVFSGWYGSELDGAIFQAEPGDPTDPSSLAPADLAAPRAG